MIYKAVIFALMGVVLSAAPTAAVAQESRGLLEQIAAARFTGMKQQSVTDPQAFMQANANSNKGRPHAGAPKVDIQTRNQQARNQRAAQLMAEQAKIDAQNVARAAEANARVAAEQSAFYSQLSRPAGSPMPAASNPAGAPAASSAPAAQPARPGVFIRPKAHDPEKPIRLFNTRKTETAE
jgi:hypothetical protein